MSLLLEDYALIGDTQSIALVGKDGSIDWLCLPRIDSGACLAALLGNPKHGRFLLAPKEAARVERRYRAGTLVLETDFETPSGEVRIVDAMPIRGRYPDVVRIVEGISGSVSMKLELTLRFDYGSIVPWIHALDGRIRAIGGPDAVVFSTPVETSVHDATIVAEFTVRAGDHVPFVMTWHPSHESMPESVDATRAIEQTQAWWRAWSGRYRHRGPRRDLALRSLITLKALTYAPTGGIVAAGTTSLPECLGGERNWDYRFGWLRDATFTLFALMHAGYTDEARAWRDWLLRAVSGDPAKLQTVYGPAGERRLDERELPWLPGYEGSRPVRIGNRAVNQLQIDVYGEVLEVLFQSRCMGLETDADVWKVQESIGNWLESHWDDRGSSLWEFRGKPSGFVLSKVMAWTAFDRLVKSVETEGLPGPVDRWRQIRDEIHDDVCRHGFDPDLGSFTQSYGSKVLDASLLLLPSTGFLPVEDPRIRGTIDTIQRELTHDGLVLRYETAEGMNADGMSGHEGAFIACSFWLADALILLGRKGEALDIIDRVSALANDVGLLSEEYDREHGRLIGNFPQAFSHVALVNSIHRLEGNGRTHAPHRARRATVR